ncbi:UTRA domain-containing protein [Azospirillum tabaci]|uniref:UTRA domain-containing protein n=1 Tax=Azospirillum tabaci TaxID=2752310 RepID=UPI001660DAE4
MKSSVEPLKARRIYLLLRDRIVAGDLPPGGRLPGEPALAAEHAVSRVTVRRALDLLEKEGLVQRKAGSGTFVHDSRAVRPIVADLSNVLSHLIDMGRSTDVKLLSFGYVAPPEAIAESLGLKPGERVQRSVRVRLIDGEPFSYLTTHVPEWLGLTYSEAELAARPLLELIERSGVKTERATQAINATLAGPEAAAALDLEIGSPLLTLTRIVHDPSGRGVEHLHALYRPDRYSFHMDLVRIGDDGERRWSPALGRPRAPSKKGR